MQYLPVHWSEGMFLRPHHFQAAERHWTELAQCSERWDHPYNYGLRQISYSPEALLNGQFQVQTCLARLPDGTLVALGQGQGPDRLEIKQPLDQLDRALQPVQVDLKQAFGIASVITVYLAVPRLKLGTANVAVNKSAGGSGAGGTMGAGGATDGSSPDGPNGAAYRYTEVRSELQDESRGGNDQEIGLRSLNSRLLIGGVHDASGYELLKIALIERAGANQATPRVSDDYIPPLLAIDAWPPLADLVRSIYDLIGNKIQVLSEQVIDRGITLTSQEPGDLDRLLMLAQLNEAYATLHVLTFATGVHPFTAYVELCRVVGKLSLFGDERRIADIPKYDHDDLARIFKWVRQQIDLLLNRLRERGYKMRYFERAGLGMQVTLDPVWLNPDWQWFVGASTSDLPESQCRELLSPGQLDWKFGSKDQVEQIFQRAEEGLRLVDLDRTPTALPNNKGWIYYQVTRQNAAWRDVQLTQTLGMRFRDKLVLNRDDPTDTRTLLVSYRGKPISLQFALFAVPPMS
jgi:type VI secretion system protein ImpJ